MANAQRHACRPWGHGPRPGPIGANTHRPDHHTSAWSSAGTSQLIDAGGSGARALGGDWTDTGKAAHHCTVIDADGTKVLSRRVPDNEPGLLELVGDVLALAENARLRGPSVCTPAGTLCRSPSCAFSTSPPRSPPASA
ncbi:IS110 family transposase [Streptomyces mutabilis]|uniref:IS110 family transposase n=1 Tax=Streptomyces mutabilis TaxID=67332 RepID=UPI0036BD2D6B